MIRRSTTCAHASFLALAAGIGLVYPDIARAAETSEAPAIIVTGQHDGYGADDAQATKTGTPLLDTPQSVTTLSRAQIDDQGVEQLGDALRYVPGVTLGQGEGHRDQIVLRGQSSSADFTINGLRDDAQYYRPLYNTERIEVMKGANALLFGRGGGGGVINRVSKVPSFGSARIGLSGGADSFGAWSLAADLNQPLGTQAALRLNATYEALANHRDAFDGHFIGIAPTAKLKLGERTTLLIAYEYAEDQRTTDRGIPSVSGVPLAGYDQSFFGDPIANRSTLAAHIVRARLDHSLSDALSVNLAGQFADYSKYYGNIYPRNANATTVEFEGYNSTTDRRNWVVQGNLVWKGETHTLLAGFEGTDQNTASLRNDALFATGSTSRITVPLAARIVLPASSFTGALRSSQSSVRALSAYLQDQIALGGHFQLIAGLRYDDLRITSLNRINGFSGSRDDRKWSPRLGLIVKPQANIALYLSYAKSFLPQSGDQFAVLDATTQTLAPEAFQNLEAGVKWDPAGALSFTAALFQLDRSNSRASDPVTGNAVITGKSRTRGIELALSGQITAHWQTSLGYSLQDGEIRSATATAPAGRKLDKLPRHQFSAWTRYDASDRLGIGLGIVHQSGQFASISNAVRLPAFTRLDAAVYYNLSDRLMVQLNVENLADTRYYPSAHTDNNIATGEPINARITARVKF